MAKNLPTPANAVSFTDKNSSDWIGKACSIEGLTQREIIIIAGITRKIQYQHGYGGNIITGTPKSVADYVHKQIKIKKPTEDEVATVFLKLYENGYIKEFSLDPLRYYFTDPNK